MGIDQALTIITQKLGRWAQDAVLLIPNLAVAVVIVIVFWIAARIARSVFDRVLRRVTLSHEAARLLSQVVYAALLVSGIFIALGVLQLERTVASLLTGVGILGLTLGFALQDIAANLVAGILIEARHPFRIGDTIETNDFTGCVDRITLRATEMTKLDGQKVLIPNKDIFNKPVINHSAASARRVDVEMPVPMQRDLGGALTAARAAIAQVRGRVAEREIEVFCKDANAAAMTLLVRFWIAPAADADYLRAKSDGIQAINRAFSTEPAERRAS